MEKNRYRTSEYRYRLSLKHPQKKLDDRRQRAVDIEAQISRLMKEKLLESRHRLALLSGRLSGMSPLEKLSQGYGFVSGSDEKKIVSVHQVKQGDRIYIYVQDGKIGAKVETAEDTGLHCHKEQ